jgi:non-haem Fe2+, alpha-ketoglutarate-dependent halogenase
VAALLGEDLLLTNSVFRIKEPGSDVRYGWHQDSARIVVEPAPAIVYVAISEATAANGCLAVVPGTHDRVQPFDLVENPGQPHRKVAGSARSRRTARRTWRSRRARSPSSAPT